MQVQIGMAEGFTWECIKMVVLSIQYHQYIDLMQLITTLSNYPCEDSLFLWISRIALFTFKKYTVFDIIYRKR